METFTFFIPQEVIASMGLINDGQTVSREVRIGDLLADGQISVDEYHALASAGVVFVQVPLFPFQAVEEAAEGWNCKFPRLTNAKYLSLIFPGGKLGPIPGRGQRQLWLPEPPPEGFVYSRMLVRASDVVRHKGYCVDPSGVRDYIFSEGIVTLRYPGGPEWVDMELFTTLQSRFNRSYFADGGRYEFSLDYIRLY
jgi:hypothetical protein